MSPAKGLKTLRNNLFDDCLSFVFSKWGFQVETLLKITNVGSKKRKSNNDEKHGHGQEKKRTHNIC